jgi:hypothetical protein
MRAKCPTHFILLNLIILVISDGEWKLLCSSLCAFTHPPVTSSLFYRSKCSRQHSLPRHSQSVFTPIFSDTLIPRPSLNVTDQVSHQHKETHEIILFYILIFTLFDRSRCHSKKIYNWAYMVALSVFSFLLISSSTQFLFCYRRSQVQLDQVCYISQGSVSCCCYIMT